MICAPVNLSSPPWVTWFGFGEDGGVLDLHEPLLSIPLSLYVVQPVGSSSLSSWWETTDGTWLGPAVVGLA
jgi:hypothetical protein